MGPYRQSQMKTCLLLLLSVLLVLPGMGHAQTSGYSLRFHGSGISAPDLDRVKIRVDPPGPSIDVGATDFTLEFWMKASAPENTAGPQSCGANINWIYGNIIFDRDRYNQDRKYGLSVAGGVLIFGVSGQGTGDRTICGISPVLDNVWHHVAVQRRRSDGHMWLFVNGLPDAQSAGPAGDISYPDYAVPGNFCGPGGSGPGALPCTNDPFLVIGAEKHDAGAQYPSYSGFIDEVRVSNVLRYPTSGSFLPPTQSFTADANTVALYHFDEGRGNVLTDSSGVLSCACQGVRNVGGALNGPEWSTDTPFNPQPQPQPQPPPTTTTVTFDNPVPPGGSGSLLNGLFQGINFGTGQWRWEGPFSPDSTNNIYFDSGTGTSRTFTFSPAPKTLVSMTVFTGVNGTLTLTDNLGQTTTRSITTGAMQSVTTGWAQASITVTVSFTAGWDLGVDDIRYR